MNVLSAPLIEKKSLKIMIYSMLLVMVQLFITMRRPGIYNFADRCVENRWDISHAPKLVQVPLRKTSNLPAP